MKVWKQGLKTREIYSRLHFHTRFKSIGNGIRSNVTKACRVKKRKKIMRFVRKGKHISGKQLHHVHNKRITLRALHILELAPSAKKGSNFTSTSAVHVGARWLSRGERPLRGSDRFEMDETRAQTRALNSFSSMRIRVADLDVLVPSA